MRKGVIFILLFIASGANTFAQTMLKVSTTDKQAINVSLDGRYFTKRGTSVTVGDLPPGRHALNIYGVVRKRNGKQREVVIYEGQVQTNNGMISILVFDPATGRAGIEMADINEYRKNNVMPPGAPAANAPQGGNYDNTDNGNDNNNDNDAPVATPVTIAEPSTLTEARTADIKKQVEAKKTDTEKMKLLKEALKSDKIITDQVGLMMDLLNFESTKLDFVKWAYTVTIDKDNYNTLTSRFTYKEYQDQFLKFLDDAGK